MLAMSCTLKPILSTYRNRRCVNLVLLGGSKVEVMFSFFSNIKMNNILFCARGTFKLQSALF